MSNDVNQRSFWSKDWVMWLFLVIFAPVGIGLLWWRKKYEKQMRIVISVFSGLLLGFYAVMAHLEEQSKKKRQPRTATESKAKKIAPLARDKEIQEQEQQKLSRPVPEARKLAVKINGKAKKEQRAVDVRRWINEAMVVARAKRKCGTIKALEDAWGNLRKVTHKDKDYRKAKAAAQRLERCRKGVVRAVSKAALHLMKKKREAHKAEVDKVFLDNGFDVKVRVLGKARDKLKMTYVLFNRVWVHKITQGQSMKYGSFLSNLQKIGFKKVIFSDGFINSYRLTLRPEDSRKVAKRATKSLGALGKPFKL